MKGESVVEVVERVVSEMKDPRIVGRTLHSLSDILVLTLAGVLAGSESWEEIIEHAHDREEWFRGFLELKNGIPSHDTIERVFERIWPEEFRALMMGLSGALHESFDGQIISIDGKSLRGSFDRLLGQKMKHLVSAFVGESGVTITVAAVPEKSNEIRAIPEVLNAFDIEGATVTLDAMGCQTAIAAQITEKKGDYVFGLKGNQGDLHDAVEKFFSLINFQDYAQTNDATVFYSIDKGHGRIEERAYFVDDDVRWLPGFSKWAGLSSIGMVISRRTEKEKTTEERRFFISSLPAVAEPFAKAVRQHWSIENGSHYVLDVTFREDNSRIRRGFTAENMAIMRRMANTLLRTDTTPRMSMRRKIGRANRSTEYMARILTAPLVKQF
jgi:predicted transposase YbfD/YdcC